MGSSPIEQRNLFIAQLAEYKISYSNNISTFNRLWESLVIRVAWDHEIVGSIPTSLITN